MKKALITGVYGQDGSYLAELLNSMGYEVHGIVNLTLSDNAANLSQYLTANDVLVNTHKCSLTDYASVAETIELIQPDECYHLAATHHSSSYHQIDRGEMARLVFSNNVISGANLLHAIYSVSSSTKLMLAGSCLMYDNTDIIPQCEGVPYNSSSVYGTSKIAVASLGTIYRKVHGLFVSNAILYNHESPRRDISFVTQKVVQNVAKIKRGEIDSFKLASLDTKKDWGFAKDYVLGMWQMLQCKQGNDFILGSGELHSIGEFVEEAFHVAGISNWNKYVDIDERVAVRDPVTLRSDPTRAKEEFGWKHSITFKGLVSLMMDSALTESL